MFSWDAAQFALALDDFDMARHQPHPPGYVLFVLIGRALRAVVDDGNLAFIVWNVLATGALGVLLFAAVLEECRSRREAVVATALFLASPLAWFYGLVAEIYVSETLGAVLVAWAAWRTRRDPRAAAWLPTSLLACGLLKLPAAVLLFPLAAWALWRHPRRVALLAACGVAVALATVPSIAAGSGAYWDALWRQFTAATSATRVSGAQAWSALGTNVRGVVAGLVAGLGPGLLVVLLARAAAFRRMRIERDALIFAMLWAGPYLFVFVFVHVAKPGYVLPLVPLMLVPAAILVARPRWLLVAVVGNAAFFLASPPSLIAAISAGPPFVGKYRTIRALQQADVRPQTTLATVREADRRLEDVIATARACPGHPIVVRDDGVVNWRRLQYEAPDLLVIGFAEGAAAPALVHDRQFEWLAPSATIEPGDCATRNARATH